MKHHLFFSVQSNKVNNYLECHYTIRNIEKVAKEINTSPGYIYLHVVDKGIYYKAKISRLNYDISDYVLVGHELNKSIPFINDCEAGIIPIFMIDYVFYIEVSELSEIKREELKHLYPKRNKRFVGAYTCSLFYTYSKHNYPFARPVLATEMFDSTFAQEILKDYFLIPEGSGGEDNNIYAEVTIEDHEFVISLTNKLMIEEDNKFINEEGSNNYRPYFYEFILDEKSVNKARDFIEPNQTYLVKLLFNRDNLMGKDLFSDSLFAGDVFFSASPPQSIPAYIEFLSKEIPDEIKEKIEEINKHIVSTVKNKAIIDKKIVKKHFFKNIFTDFIVDNIQVYNVGQGNWSKVQLKNHNEDAFDIVFDIGVANSIKKHPQYMLNAKRAVKELSAKYMFILSHWDLDHIKGVIYLDKDKFEVPWILPQLPKRPSRAALRLAAYLYIKNNNSSLFISECLGGHVVFNEKGFRLAKGKGKKNYYSIENNLGIILEIMENGKRVLLPGDCEYDQMPDNFLTGYDFMVASHHGARTVLSKSGLKAGVAAVFTVNLGCERYPHESHEEQLVQLGYQTETINKAGYKRIYSF